MSNFSPELRRRKVYRVAAIYVLAGFVFVEFVANLVAQRIVNWDLTLIVSLALAGFPIVLFCAWEFGITRAGFVEEKAERKPVWPYRILLLVLGAVIAIVIGSFWVPHASRFMALARKLPTDGEVQHSVRIILAPTHRDPDSIEGDTKLSGPAGEGEHSLGLDGDALRVVCAKLNNYIGEFQAKERISEAEFKPKKTVGQVVDLVEKKLKIAIPTFV